MFSTNTNSLAYDLGSYCLIPHIGCQVGHHIAKGIEGAQRKLEIRKMNFVFPKQLFEIYLMILANMDLTVMRNP